MTRRGSFSARVVAAAVLLGLVLVLESAPRVALAEGATALFAGVGVQSDKSGERLDRIRAGYYLDTDLPTGKNVGFLLGGDLAFDGIMIDGNEKTKGLARNELFAAEVAAWRAAHYFTGSANPAEDALDVQGYYEDIIFKVLKADVSSAYPMPLASLGTATKAGVDLCGKQDKVVDGIVSAMKDAEMLKYDFGSLGPEQADKLESALKSMYFDEHPYLDTWAWGAEGVNEFLSAAKSIQEGVEGIVSYGNLVEATRGQAELLRRMYVRCPTDTAEDLTLKAALDAAQSAVGGQARAYLTGSAIAVEKVLGKTSGELARMVLDEAMTACPHLQAFMVGAKLGDAGGTLVANVLTSTDELIEQYEKSLALKTFCLLAADVTERAGASYASCGRALDAQTFLAGVDVLYNAKLEAVDYAKEFYDLVYDKAVFGKVFEDRGEYQRILDDVSRVRADLEEMRDSLYGNFRVSFHEDNPALYRQYFGDGAPHAMGGPDLAELVEAGSATKRANGDGGTDGNGSQASPDTVESPDVDLGVLNSGVTAGNDFLSQTAPEAYAAYTAKLQEYIATYGAPGVVGSNPYSAEGVCVAELVDFDANGTEEFLVIYYDRAKARDTFTSMNDGGAYVAEVWAYEDGELRQAYRQPTQSTNAGFGYQSRPLLDDGASWMESEEYAGSYYFNLWEIVGGASSVRHTYEVRDEYTANESHWADGVEEHRFVPEWKASFFTEWVTYKLMGDGPDAERTGTLDGERYYTPYGCVDLALDTMQRLGVSLDSVQGDESTPTPAHAQIESQAKGQVVYADRADYDSDGFEEEFVVTGSPVSEYDWVDAELWLVSSEGRASRVAGEETFRRMLAHGEDSTLRLRDRDDPGGSVYTFFCVESTVGGPTTTSHVYGVRDGAAIEIPFDVEYIGNARSDEDLEQIVGSVSVLDNGRKWQKYGFTFDPEALVFVSTGAIGEPDFVP